MLTAPSRKKPVEKPKEEPEEAPANELNDCVDAMVSIGSDDPVTPAKAVGSEEV